MNHTVREYLVELEQENPVEAPVQQQETVSTTDPDSTYATKGGIRRGSAITTTIWWITTVASSWGASYAGTTESGDGGRAEMIARFAQWQGESQRR